MELNEFSTVMVVTFGVVIISSIMMQMMLSIRKREGEHRLHEMLKDLQVKKMKVDSVRSYLDLIEGEIESLKERNPENPDYSTLTRIVAKAKDEISQEKNKED